MGFFGQASSPMGGMMTSIGKGLRKKATADGVPEGLFQKIQQDHQSKIGKKPFMDSFVGGLTAPDIEEPTDRKNQLLRKKNKTLLNRARTSTIDTDNKSLLGN